MAVTTNHVVLGAVGALAYIRARLPPELTPTWETWRSWSRPSWRRRHPVGYPVPSGRVGRRIFWRRQHLDAWIADRSSKAAGTDGGV